MAPGRVASDAALTPGELLAGRYRIIGLLGRGGMGEVYRADDLTLAQPVALKFLPANLANDPAWIERFHHEVRNARQVSHPNVCRVYDIGEAEGRHFISMEFVDGEDLATLLIRIGRLPSAKANEVAQQLCAGLAAAHDKGLLHRDLKPSNVMLDGHGRVRIADFGLAVSTEEASSGETVGTPAYMAPEQFGGAAVTVRSDLYSLGLILYEIYSGHRAIEAGSFAEMKQRHHESVVKPPSQFEGGFDEQVERAILQCLEKDPARRPASALELSAMLPGGNLLAAAIASGQTPSPEMVADAGSTGGLRPSTAWLLLLAFLVLLVCALNTGARTDLLSQLKLEKSPSAMRERAREVLARVGLKNEARDHWAELRVNSDYISHVTRSDTSVTRWSRLGTPRGAWAVTYCYRESPHVLRPMNLIMGLSETDPPSVTAGMVTLDLDARGRLTRLVSVPPATEDSARAPAPPPWAQLFAASGMDSSRFRRVAPGVVPGTYADDRMAWEGRDTLTGLPVRIEAAAFRGTPVSFVVLPPWWRAAMASSNRVLEGGLGLLAGIIMLVPLLTLIVRICLLARSNLRQGRGDRRGALRLGVSVALLGAASVALEQHHAADATELLLPVIGLVVDVGILAVFIAVCYLALEPYLRRLWPERMVAWMRVLDGRWRDPLVGRDTLLGVIAGTGLAGLVGLQTLIPLWTGVKTGCPVPEGGDLSKLGAGGSYMLDNLLNTIMYAEFFALSFMLGFLLLLLLVRRRWLAGVLIIVLVGFFQWTSVAARMQFAPWSAVAFSFLIASLMLGVMFRLGPFALVAMFFASSMLSTNAISSHLWFSGRTAYATLVLVAVAVYGFVVSLAGRPAFGRGDVDSISDLMSVPRRSP